VASARHIHREQTAAKSNMIWYYVILFVTSLFTAAFSWVPQITTLPVIFGVDIDAQLIAAMQIFFLAMDSFWYLSDIFIGALFLMTYYAIKLGLKLFFGHRVPH